jgi:phosphotriesterase-related protein
MKPLDRREFLRISGVASIGILTKSPGVAQAPPGQGMVMTVLGPVSRGAFGSTLPHEHVLVDFTPADEFAFARYDPNTVFKLALPKLAAVHKLDAEGSSPFTRSFRRTKAPKFAKPWIFPL